MHQFIVIFNLLQNNTTNGKFRFGAASSTRPRNRVVLEKHLRSMIKPQTQPSCWKLDDADDTREANSTVMEMGEKFVVLLGTDGSLENPNQHRNVLRNQPEGKQMK